MKIHTRVEQHEKYIAMTNPKRRNPYPSEITLLARDLEFLLGCLEQGVHPPKEWCLALGNPPHPGYDKSDAMKRRWRYAAKGQ